MELDYQVENTRSKILNLPFMAKINEKASVYTEKLEDILSKHSDKITRMARFLLVMTFLEDALRVVFQFDVQTDILVKVGFPEVVGQLYLLCTTLLQLSGSACVVLNKKLRMGAMFLIASILMHLFVYSLGHFSGSIRFPPYAGYYMWIISNLAVVGGLLMLLAQEKRDRSQEGSVFAGISMGDTKEITRHLQLAGRVLIALIFFMMSYNLRFSANYVWLKRIGLAIPPLLILLGFKTRYATILLAALLMVLNFTFNAFWRIGTSSTRDIYQYYLFLNLSVMGGLFLVLMMGPGTISLDDRKKKF
eukprot:Rmarinus@m.2495